MNPEAFTRLVRAVQVQTVLLLSTAAEANFAAPDGDDEPLKADFDVAASGRIVRQGEAALLACEVAISFVGTAGDHALCNVRAKYGVAYSLAPSYEEEEGAVKFFAENNALFNVWPFFREHLHSLTLRMGMPPFVLPLLHPRVKEVTAPREKLDGAVAVAGLEPPDDG